MGLLNMTKKPMMLFFFLSLFFPVSTTHNYMILLLPAMVTVEVRLIITESDSGMLIAMLHVYNPESMVRAEATLSVLNFSMPLFTSSS